MIPTTSNTGELYQKVKNVLRSMRLPRHLDVDSLTQEIYFEAWNRRRPLSGLFISHRAINAIRKLRGEITYYDSSDPVPPTEATTEMKSTISALITSANLHHAHMVVIYQIFYCGRSITQTASTLGWSETRVSDIYHSALKKLQAVARGGVE